METMLELSDRKKLVVVELAPSWKPIAEGTSSPWTMVATVVW